MLKNIRLHIEQDEEKQAALEEKLAKHISITQKDNINAFQRYIPSLLNYVKKAKSQNISIFCNKFSKFNIVDYGQGRVFYGLDPGQEISNQVAAFKAHSLYIGIDSEPEIKATEQSAGTTNLPSLSTYKSYLGNQSFPNECELLVVLGIGLGQHIKLLLEASTIKHLIIYEPELQYFNCSVMVTAWREILEVAKQKNTAVYLQLEKDGRDLINDIMELRCSSPVSGFYLFQHYHHPVFNSLYKSFNQKNWSTLVDKGISFKMHEASDEYCPLWSPVNNLVLYQELENTDKQYQDNLQAFKTYFPKIHKEFENYKPKKWLPIRKEDGQINILNMENLTAWYSDKPLDDCTLNFDNYSQQPNKDGLVLGYTGEKLKHYIHYQFVKETEDLLKDIEEEQGVLPPTIKSLIMFGLGVGYQVEHLMSKHKVEKLFICEPNRDFFYASLFAINWVSVLRTIDEQEGRLYINIGDDGTNLFRDLLNQFYSIGPYVLSQTYFYQSYYNAALTHSIGQLREQLQVVIAMGEYFDHARFGIAHTKEAFLREYPHMRNGAEKYLTFDEKEVPIMFVGNGPSLDHSIDALKQWKDNAIIISCGTALQVLHRNGIKPDFHAEIEQNRSTFDWAARIEDFDYLKSITLISCNGIHPDTCNLYKDVLIAFKEGESSTVSTIHVLGEDKYETLKYAFPTVTNFALNFFIKLGFKQHYLIGVDLGFVDIAKHHSVQSGYYCTEGNQLYDYAEKNNGSIVVPGNFRKTVFTKQEFKIARIVMEQSLNAAKAECYNTSDGAKIIGSMPLHQEDILLISDENTKKNCLLKLKESCFLIKDKSEFIEQYETKFSKTLLGKEFSMFKKRLKQPVENLEQAELLIESQKRMLFASYQQGQSLLFYLTYGTVNYASVVLNKIAYSSLVFNKKPFEKARLLWLKYFDLILSESTKNISTFDYSKSFLNQRMLAVLKHAYKNKRILVITDSQSFYEARLDVLNLFGLLASTTFLSVNNVFNGQVEVNSNFDYVIFYKMNFDNSFIDELYIKFECIIKKPILVLVDRVVSEKEVNSAPDNICFFICPGNMLIDGNPIQCNDVQRLITSCFMLLDCSKFRFLYSKYTVSSHDKIFLEDIVYDGNSGCNFYDIGFAIAANYKDTDLIHDVFLNGCRAQQLEDGISPESLSSAYIEDEKCLKVKQTVITEYPYLLENAYYV